MKKLLLLLLLISNLHLVFSQQYDVQAIKLSGDDDKRINLVIISEGYQSSEFSNFETDATNFMNAMFGQEPFASYENYFNVYIIKVPSLESGASHPGTAYDENQYNVPTQTVDNHFGTTYDSYDIHRLLYTMNQGAISTVLANNFPQYDQALILVNSPYYGGSGGEFPITSTGQYAEEIAIHELGHSFADLKDEYYPGDNQVAEAANMTQETNPNSVKWKNWMGVNGIGIYPHGTTGISATWYRPHQTCLMRYVGYNYPFCAVCKERIIEKIHDLVSPIDSYTPAENTISELTYPIEFQLNTIQTLPTNTLETTWTLNGNYLAENTETVTLEENDLVENSNNTLTVVVHDANTQINIDSHETTHVSTVTWVIDNTLGVHDIQENDYSLTMYPNPSRDFVNITLENSLSKDVVVEIISIEGRSIQTVNLLNNQNSQIDISSLSQGVYITNFYSEGVLIATKKLVKN
ncbi:M64 family metallopeptidase [Oceanihabitans sediminis]|uniref:T9SS C-terminal target domain-containing protein n=1 Tax=Oceanihabitans sediminis TaxID=1812012 RepID=A0A368P9L5_9FLAO|nr:M64 family metallopeptidase [Oceanihabitans sediminis]MDX1278764.1 M64 family metallopeptidase [Oceanihabitans sediminis]MDX1773810.1 M64 family metallopeptidase [Oceanihabitans sediminis]RBP32166.1 putative secreted protein (Por secretion system target) [Oceanihabitans sediminis]RCU58814.1 T9SS C-terminal target domain-containing protein [Oceanihabitans sediminis]